MDLNGSACHVCGRGEHPTTGHAYWPNADADKWSAAQPTARHSPESAYVTQHRPA